MQISKCVRCQSTLYKAEDGPLKGMWVDAYDYHYCESVFTRTGNMYAHIDVDTYETDMANITKKD